MINSTVSATGNDSFALNNEAVINGSVTASDNGTFVLHNAGAIAGQVLFSGSGANTINNDEEAIITVKTDLGGVFSGVTATGSSSEIINNRGIISGQILLGDGNDVLNQYDGSLQGIVETGAGDDKFGWSGGRIAGTIRLGSGDDLATLTNLTPNEISNGREVYGGIGSDVLIFDNVSNADASTGQGSAPPNFKNFEDFQLTNGSKLAFIYTSGTLVLGDEASKTGSLSIDATSQVLAGNSWGYAIEADDKSQLAYVRNSGTIDLTNEADPGTWLHDTLRISGNYLGLDGKLKLHTVLNGDYDSSSDRLVLSGAGATASGNTYVYIANVGGAGALTTGDGIRVIDATGGAETEASAFVLGAPAAAGVFEYSLFRGGRSGADPSDWFLRSSLEPTDPTDFTGPTDPTSPTDPTAPTDPTSPTDPTAPTDPTSPTDPTAPTDPTSPTDPTAPTDPTSPTDPTAPTDPTDPTTPTDPPVPNIRPEIPGYTIQPALAYRIGMAALGTFHTRYGDQMLMTNEGNVSAVWGRIFGSKFEQHSSARIGNLRYDLSPGFEGTIGGMQAGVDLLGPPVEGAESDRAGLLYSFASISGDPIGDVLGRLGVATGDASMSGHSLGAYWTRIWEDGSYLDAVAMVTLLSGQANSDRRIGVETSGQSMLASLEGGHPIPLDGGWTIEPQAQLVWMRIDIDDTNDGYSHIDYGAYDAWTGRIGVRAERDMSVEDRPAQFFVSANLWHVFSAEYQVEFNEVPVRMDLADTALEISGGVSAQITDQIGLWGSLFLNTSVTSGNDSQAIGGTAGLRYQW